MLKSLFARHQPDVSPARWIKAGIGAFAAFALASALGDATGASFVFAPMAASAVLIYGVPESPLSQPAHVVGGHMVAAALALAADRLVPHSPLALVATVSAVIVVLGLMRLTHPPAGATALVVCLTHPGPMFLVNPVLASSLTLVAVAVAIHRLPPRTTYPLPPRRIAAAE